MNNIYLSNNNNEIIYNLLCFIEKDTNKVICNNNNQFWYTYNDKYNEEKINMKIFKPIVLFYLLIKNNMNNNYMPDMNQNNMQNNQNIKYMNNYENK